MLCLLVCPSWMSVFFLSLCSSCHVPISSALCPLRCCFDSSVSASAFILALISSGIWELQKICPIPPVWYWSRLAVSLTAPFNQLPQNAVEKQSGTTSQWAVGNMAARKITLCSPGFQPSYRHFRSGSAFNMLLASAGCISVKWYKAMKSHSRHYLSSVGMEKYWPHLHLADPVRLWGDQKPSHIAWDFWFTLYW